MLLESEPAQKGKASGRWDQFAANQQLFGTATSYNEDLYTTKLDAGASGISVQEAERLAAEIQAGTTSNRHMAEERGARVNDSGVGVCSASAVMMLHVQNPLSAADTLLRCAVMLLAYLEGQSGVLVVGCPFVQLLQEISTCYALYVAMHTRHDCLTSPPCSITSSLCGANKTSCMPVC